MRGSVVSERLRAPRRTSTAVRGGVARLLVLVLVVGLPVAASRADGAPGWGIASAHPRATEAGREILEAGGNAFDAAVAVSAALAVVEPYSSGLGGGGFWLLHVGASGRNVMVDGRERAPLAATPTMYQDDQGRLIDKASINGPGAAGIPGEPAALVHIAKTYGTLSLARDLRPAIRLARDGFHVDDRYRSLASFRKDVLAASPAAAATYLVDGQVPPEGYLLRQPQLADTLEALAHQGRSGFYDGPVAERLVAGVRAAGGIWSRRDLRAYRAVERPPITGTYRGMRIVSASPPSSGGVALVEMLNILKGYDLDAADEALRTHLVVEAMRRAYHDRNRYLGDTDYVDVPIDLLTDPRYAAGLRATIRKDRATPSSIFPGVAGAQGGPDTTHFSIVDPQGNRVAATLSVNWPFGSCFMPPGTGVVLNDEMDDFAAKPGVANVYGLVQGKANAIAPGKRMLSSMSPTFLQQGDRTAVIGTPGGSRIITMVLLGALAFHDGASPRAIVRTPRYHNQYLPDEIQYEPGAFTPDVAAALRARGHKLHEIDRHYGNMQVVVIDRGAGRVEAASDPRGIGASAAGTALEGR